MFSKQYICLVASLREYALDSDVRGLDLGEIQNEVFSEFSSSDSASVKLLYGYYDCENLASAYSGRTYHNPFGLLSKESIEAALHGDVDQLEGMPSSISDIVTSYSLKGSDRADSETSQRFYRALFTAYYKACSGSKSKFLRRWSEADCNLRNVAAAITARVANRAISDVVVGESDVVDQLCRSSAADFGLRGELPYLDSVIGAIADEQNIVEKEHRIDMIRWSLAEELSEGEYFSADVILAYLAKVNIIARWQILDPNRGRELFQKMADELSGKDLINNK